MKSNGCKSRPAKASEQAGSECCHSPGEIQITEERKFAILFAATILAERKLIDADLNRASIAKGFFVDRAIDDAAFILERIDTRWPTKT